MAWTLWSEIRNGQPVTYERGPSFDRLPTNCVYSGDSCWAEELNSGGEVERVYMWSGEPKGIDRRSFAGPTKSKALRA